MKGRGTVLVMEPRESGDGVMCAFYRHRGAEPEDLGMLICDIAGSVENSSDRSLTHLVGTLATNVSGLRFIRPPIFDLDQDDSMRRLNSWADSTDDEWLYIVGKDGEGFRVTAAKTVRDYGPDPDDVCYDSFVEPEIVYEGDIDGMRERFGCADGVKP